METLDKIAWRKIAEPIPFEQAEVGDIFIWISDDRDQFTLDFRGTLYALKGDMGVIVTHQYSNHVGNFFKDAYRRACFITSQKVDIYKAEDYDTIDMERYNKKGPPPKLSWKRIFDNVSFEELPHVIGPNQIWKASISDPMGQYPYFIIGPNGAFLEIQKHRTQEPFIVVANAMWTRDINEAAWLSEGNIHKNFTPFTLVSKDTVQSSDQNLEDFLNGLTPDDIGEEVIGPYLVAFEGFNPACWEDVEKQGKSLDDLAKEILEEWVNKYQSQYIRHGWARGGEFGEDDIFYAIFPNTQKLSWSQEALNNTDPPKKGDTVKVIADRELLDSIKLPQSYMPGSISTVRGIFPDADWLSNLPYKGSIDIDPWGIPLSHWRQFLTIVSRAKLSWKIVDIKEGDSVRITANKNLLHSISIKFSDDIVGELGTVISVDQRVVIVDVEGDQWAFPLSHWQQFLTIASRARLAWQERLDPAQVWGGKIYLKEHFWKDLANSENDLMYSEWAGTEWEGLPKVVQDAFADDVMKWETERSNNRLSWKAIFEPDKDVATVMYALSGTDYPFVISVLLGLSDITSRAILGALAVGGYEEASQEFDKFVEDCNSIVDGAMVHYNVNNIDTDKVKEYATTLPDFSEMGDKWGKLSQILKEVSSTTVNKKTSSIGAHVAWHFPQIPEVSPYTRVSIELFLRSMDTSTISIAPFTRGFGSKTYLSNLKAALQHDKLVDLYNDVVWLVNKSNDFLDIAHLEMAQRNVTSISFDTILTVQDKEEYSQKYEALYNTFQQIVGGGNG